MLRLEASQASMIAVLIMSNIVGADARVYPVARRDDGGRVAGAVESGSGTGICSAGPIQKPYKLVVNDFDADVVRSIGSTPWSEGTHRGCNDGHSHDAQSRLNYTFHNQGINEPTRPANGLDFHHDNALDKGKVAVEYAPSLAQCGCYMIYEMHPGGPTSDACAGWLPRRAPMEVTDANGITFRRFVDQSKLGGQWNPLACYFLPEGPQRVVVSNEGTDNCLEASGPEQRPCFWVVSLHAPSHCHFSLPLLTATSHCHFSLPPLRRAAW